MLIVDRALLQLDDMSEGSIVRHILSNLYKRVYQSSDSYIINERISHVTVTIRLGQLT